MRKINKLIVASIHLISLLLVCYLNNLLLESNTAIVGLCFPGLIWGCLFFVFNLKTIKDKSFAGIGFITSNLFFWPLILFIGATAGMMLYSIHPVFVFPLVGGFAALCSYYLFSVFILSNYLPKQALVSCLLGMASFVIIEMYKSSLMINNLIFTWQLLVGSGLIYFGIKNRKTSAKKHYIVNSNFKRTNQNQIKI